MHNIVYILIVFISCTFADVTFVKKPPEEVRTFPGQHVTLPCVLENLQNNQIVQWIYHVNRNSFTLISENMKIFKPGIIGKDFSIIGDEMNFTLLFKIPDNIDFGSDLNVTTLYECVVLKTDGVEIDISAYSNVIIQRLKYLNPICGKIMAYYIIGEILTLGCYHDSDPTVITTLKSGNGKVLPSTYLEKTQYIIHKLTLTKGDHNAMFVCESRRNITNEIKNCSMGPITVNYKPEINITRTSATEFHCTADARPPVNETHWVMEPSIPQDSFTISWDGILRFMVPLDYEMKITCEAENTIGRGNKTLRIPNVNRYEENGSGNIPTVNNQDEDDGFDSTSVIIVVICVLFCVVVAILIILLFLRRKRIKHQQTSKRQNMSAKFRSDDPQVELKNEVYDYAAIDVNEFRADYQETENEIYVGGDETNVVNEKQSNTVLKDLDEIRDTVNRAQPHTNCEKLKNEQQVYSQVNKPDYKECENEIYQGPE